jgi:hypothetical protein
MAWCPTALPSVPHNEGRSLKVHSRFRPCPLRLRRVADDGSRWRGPARPHGSDADRKNGSAASELCCRCASLHHGSGQQETLRIQACGAIRAPSKQAPLRSSSRPQRAFCRPRCFEWVALRLGPRRPLYPRLPPCSGPSRTSLRRAARVLDSPCARRRRKFAVGAEVSLRRGRTKVRMEARGWAPAWAGASATATGRARRWPSRSPTRKSEEAEKRKEMTPCGEA